MDRSFIVGWPWSPDGRKLLLLCQTQSLPSALEHTCNIGPSRAHTREKSHTSSLHVRTRGHVYFLPSLPINLSYIVRLGHGLTGGGGGGGGGGGRGSWPPGSCGGDSINQAPVSSGRPQWATRCLIGLALTDDLIR